MSSSRRAVRTKRGKGAFRRALEKVARWLEGKGTGQWRSAGGVVVDRRGAVALIRQKKKWTFPKGRVDPGEAINHAARREVLEEAGLEVRICEYLGVSLGLRHVTHYFLMSLDRNVSDHDDEVDEVRFMKPAKAEKLLTRRDRRVLKRALAALAGEEQSHPTAYL